MGERRVFLVRHGQTEYNATGRMQGQLDTDLSPVGVQQAKVTAQMLGDKRIARVIASDLKRAYDTALILAEPFGCEVTTDTRLRETDLGQWQGASREEVDRDFPGQRAYWRHDPQWAPPGGETRLEVAERAYAVIEEIMATDIFDDGDVMIVAHGGTIGALTARLLDLPVRYYPVFTGLGNACWSQLLARPRFTGEATGTTPVAVDGSMVPLVPSSRADWWKLPQWHLEGWNLGVATDASPDEGALPGAGPSSFGNDAARSNPHNPSEGR
ncbi:histidine phosphatase family protein [Corynebacterium evansiae]|uniref:histidine phosphatase family protein n=1 Tax=Corynebacterium evansiae TaxID=2913499 RepID=UPI003EBE5D22